MTRKIEDLKKKLRVGAKRRSDEIIAQKDAVIKECKLWIVKIHEYDEELMPEVKKALDMDIKDYRRMIQDEEGRCGKLNMMLTIHLRNTCEALQSQT